MTNPKDTDRFKAMTSNPLEEDYFFKRDRELIQALRDKADAEKKRLQREQEKEAHWLHCPKCGGQMAEIALDVLRLDKCRECRGVYFDDGEIEILRQMQLKADSLAALAEKLRQS
jgi:hypothetical protein